ncbi:MAG: gamma-glutamyl-gamma-aminobutyrate hydrolase family protein [Chloroflexi bacterium]|nr:gamma-glutamyl-gamma-aminobutyrate hydrolase family protein [Chloroflexota bacterium]
MSKPIIGITTYHEINEQRRWRFVTNQTYVDAILNAGGIPVLIPLNIVQSGDDSLLRALYERIDGVLIPGGGDIHPEFYSQYITPKDTKVDRNRDKVEITLAIWAYEDDQPLLGICRGQQVINVALGGTLIHDIPSEKPSQLLHDYDDHIPPSHLAHNVDLDRDSQLGKILGVSKIEVNSLHHQAIEQIAPVLKVNAYADDGIIEGVEVPDAYFYIGVQWHPEWMTANVPAMKNLFHSFVEACAKKMTEKQQV